MHIMHQDWIVASIPIPIENLRLSYFRVSVKIGLLHERPNGLELS